MKYKDILWNQISLHYEKYTAIIEYHIVIYETFSLLVMRILLQL